MDFRSYYERYWNDRKEKKSESIEPIRSIIPKFLVKYSSYGAILHQVSEKSHVLDIGCGDGNVSSLYLTKGCTVTGIDISEKALKYAAGQGIKILKYNINEIPLPIKNESFDIVIFSDVLEHVIDPFSLLVDTHRILKKNGKIIISVPNFARFSNRLRMLIGDPIDLLHFDKYGDDVEHLHWFTVPKMKYLLKKSGYSHITICPIGLPFGFIFGLMHLWLSRQILITGLKK